MKIRRFTGATMGEALKAVKAALGAEAVILDTAAADVGVVVTAAVDDDDPLADPLPPAAVAHTDDVRDALPDAQMVREVRGLLAAVHEFVDAQWSTQVPGVGEDMRTLHRRLVAQGVD